MKKTSCAIAGTLFLCSIAVQAGVEATTPDGRTVLLKDDHTWVYTDSVEDSEKTYALLSVVRRQQLPNGCRFGLKLQNDLGFRIKSLVPQFSAYKAGNVLYQTVSKGFSEIRPTNSQYRQIYFSRVRCDDIESLKVHGAEHCTMGPYTKFSVLPGECLDRIKVEKSDLVKISK